MAPSATEPQTQTPVSTTEKLKGETSHKYLSSTGILDQYDSFDVTPVIGREFPNANLVDWLQAPNSDEVLRELAITISQRGVVFFRAQDNLSTELQKELIQRLGLLSGKPSTSGLHIHPILNSEREDYKVSDPEISTIDSELYKKLYNNTPLSTYSVPVTKKQNSGAWHSDIAFEPVPADYSSLRLEKLPKTGGDTLWASGYDIYDRISRPVQRFLESLDAVFEQPGFHEVAKNGGFELYDKERGAPENVGRELRAVHPVVRTNPVTGWKSIFPVGGHVTRINGLTENESTKLLKWLVRLLVDNHDLQVRFRWRNQNDIAIWDNRSTFHTATYDHQEFGERYGVRTVSVGEKPFFDPESKSRTEDVFAQAQKAAAATAGK